MPRLTIPTRIFLSIVLVLLAFGAVSGVSLYQHQRTAVRLRLLHEGYLPLALTIGQAHATQAVYQTLLDQLLHERNPLAGFVVLDEMRRVRPATMRRVITGIERVARLEPPPDERAALDELRETLDGLRSDYIEGDEDYARLAEAIERANPSTIATSFALVSQREQLAARGLRRARDQVQGRIAQTSASAAEQERQFVYAVAALAFVALLVGLIVLWWSQRLLAPLPVLQRRVAAVAKGDLAPTLAPARDDEIGQLTVEFERMVDAVGARDRALREAADTLRQLQQMQEQIVAGLRAAVVVVAADGSVRSANPAAEEVLGLTREDMGAPLGASGLLDRFADLGAAIANVSGGDARASLIAAPLVVDETRGARAVDVLVTPFGVESAAGPRRDVLVVADDVTEELRTKQRLIQTERLAAIGRMAAHVTHEVRNPLSSIGLNVELLEEELVTSGAETKALLRAIQREIDHLTSITEEYLRLARLPQPRLEPENLGQIVEEVGRFVAREFETSAVTLRVDIDDELPIVAADEPQIRQALLNLLRNARESMPDGGEVTLSARAVEGGLAIAVADEGEGISQHARAHIFDLFYSTKERGSGLGLPLTQQIVSAHGGVVRCEDAPGRGTVFTMWFPPHRADHHAAAQ
ncbi:MAG: ATP-binding protein [Sandaracinaceae bacterium]